MLYGLIIAAGNQSRFSSSIPKALYPIKDTNALNINLIGLRRLCSKIFVVCSENNKDWFSEFNYNTYERMPIESGLGCGDAVLKALKNLNLNDDDEVIIQWGDSIHLPESYAYLVNNSTPNSLNILVREEDNPYVSISTNPNKVSFSKFNEKVNRGYHDLSLFFGNAKYILKYCEAFRDKYFNLDKYEHKHGDEFNFLDIINDTNIYTNLVNIGSNVVFVDFNTVEEFLEKVNLYDAYKLR